MRVAALAKTPLGSKVKVSTSISLSAPVGGWNARDPVFDMDPEDAIELENWFPTPSDVVLRKGHVQHATGITGQVDSLMVYNNPDGSQKMFSASGTVFHDVTLAGAVGAAVQTALTNARWENINFTTTVSTFLIAVNGLDKPRYFDGTVWIAVDAVSVPAITGITTTELSHVAAHKNRVWFVRKNSLSAWYLPTDAVGGLAVEFPLSGVAKKGGSLVAIDTWTIDGGEGVDDLWVAVTSEGEIIVYKGTDPTASTTWALVGVWSLAMPIGKRCFLKWGGDLLYNNKEGLFPLSKALISGQERSADPRVALTDKISKAIVDAASLHSTKFGWQVAHYPNGSQLILNVPIEEGDNQQQFVVNTLSGAWARFNGINANCWAIFNGEPYFGSNTFVGQFWSTLADNGTNIQGIIFQAFNDLEFPGIKKEVKAIRPIFSSNGQPAVLISINVDYETVLPTGSVSFSPLTSGIWDTSLWDTGIWGGGLSVIKNWITVGGTGIVVAPSMFLASQGIDVRLNSYDLLFEIGGVLG